MNNQHILRCCENTPVFLITYQTGSQYYVCKICLSLPHWSRGQQEVKEIKN